jgi:hypothetical protein
MKILIFFFFSGLSAITCFSQDTLVDSKGFIFPARITEMDSNVITYASADTLLKDQIIVQRSNIIFIKYQSGRTEQLYLCDTLIMKDGEIIKCKVLEIDQSTLTYFTFHDKFTSPTVIVKSDLFIIKFHDGTKEMGSQLSQMSNSDYLNLGASDAKLYYKVKPAVIVSEVIMGVGTIFIAPIIAGIIIAYMKPTKLENAANPNNDLLISNKHYKNGYQNKAQIKKILVASLSYFSGIAGFIGVTLVAFSNI